MEETLLFQLEDDLQKLFNDSDTYSDVKVKHAYDGDTDISYPMVIIQELDNYYNSRYYNLEEHVVNVGYQFTILAEQTITDDAVKNVKNIMTIIKNFMRGEKYHALEQIGDVGISTHPKDTNIKIGYLRYNGCIDIDTNTIYRRS